MIDDGVRGAVEDVMEIEVSPDAFRIVICATDYRGVWVNGTLSQRPLHVFTLLLFDIPKAKGRSENVANVLLLGQN